MGKISHKAGEGIDDSVLRVVTAANGGKQRLKLTKKKKCNRIKTKTQFSLKLEIFLTILSYSELQKVSHLLLPLWVLCFVLVCACRFRIWITEKLFYVCIFPAHPNAQQPNWRVVLPDHFTWAYTFESPYVYYI